MLVLPLAATTGHDVMRPRLDPAPDAHNELTVELRRAFTLTFELQASRHIAPFFAPHRASLAVTTYQAAKLPLPGAKPDGKLSVFESLPRCMGLAASPGRLDIATLSQLWQFRDALAGEPATGKPAGHNAIYAPRQARSPATGQAGGQPLRLRCAQRDEHA